MILVLVQWARNSLPLGHLSAVVTAQMTSECHATYFRDYTVKAPNERWRYTGWWGVGVGVRGVRGGRVRGGSGVGRVRGWMGGGVNGGGGGWGKDWTSPEKYINKWIIVDYGGMFDISKRGTFSVNAVNKCVHANRLVVVEISLTPEKYVSHATL